VLAERAGFVKETIAQVKYDVFVPGELDMQDGLDSLIQWQQKTGIPFYAANLVDAQTGQPIFGKSTVLERDGLRIAFVGIVGPAAFAISPANADFNFEAYKKEQRFGLKDAGRLMKQIGDVAATPEGEEQVTQKKDQLEKLAKAFQQGQGEKSDDDTEEIKPPVYEGRKFRITDPLAAANAEMEALKGKADLFVIVDHMERPEMEELRKQATGYQFFIDGHADKKSAYQTQKQEPNLPNVIRVGSKGKVVGILKLVVVDNQLVFEDRSNLKKSQADLERTKKRLAEMVKKAGGDPLKKYKPEDREYKQYDNTKKRADKLEAELKPVKPTSFFELDRVSLDKEVASDPSLEKRQDEIQPPSQRGH
jgi:2',3'-cyclic-nucleotide 2'-phosphodiesterase (5'-nucleotidase family)